MSCLIEGKIQQGINKFQSNNNKYFTAAASDRGRSQPYVIITHVYKRLPEIIWVKIEKQTESELWDIRAAESR